ncbi:MAG TPA: DNA polymerase III subunit beta [bacterium]|nr:DNA polymerase III subunit beta [bacterium]HOC88819.1 DNA polymerase III subunit beta [bacterium]HOZ20237.1 DNA polymerase III subunit beta [bacterium]
MNFTVSKKEFFDALQKVIGVVPPKTTISILTCILLDLREGKLSLTGTDLEISITTTLDVNGTEEGSVAIPAKILVEIVRELPDVPLNLFSDADNKVTIRTEKGEYKLSTQPKEDFPQISVEEGELAFQMDSGRLGRMAEQTIFAVSADELRPALTGINMELLPGEIRFVATDGHRLAKITVTNGMIADDVRRNLIIPTKTLHLLLRNFEDDANVGLQIGEDHIVFTLERAVVYSKLISGTYPNYERVLPKDNELKLQINRELLISSLRRVSIFSSSLTHQVRLMVAPDEVTVRSEDIEFGAEAKEAIPASFNGEWLQIGYNSNYLMDVLRHLDGEEIVFELKDATSAAILKPVEKREGEEVVMLLMPIRINEAGPATTTDTSYSAE